jgi:DNA-directed RNA polymerase subunit RPC12/RpoP
MATLLRHRKSAYQRGMVTCRKCAAPIPVQKLTDLADEVSLRCPKCGDRGFYAKQAIVVDEFPERRKKPRP